MSSRESPARRILIVDDDKAIRVLLTAILTRSGFRVDTARDGSEAIAMIGTTGFAAIVLDLMMPNVDGFEVIEHLRSTSPDSLRASVIVLSAASSKDLRRVDGDGVFRVIRKPFDLRELVTAVTECVGRAEEPPSGSGAAP